MPPASRIALEVGRGSKWWYKCRGKIHFKILAQVWQKMRCPYCPRNIARIAINIWLIIKLRFLKMKEMPLMITIMGHIPGKDSPTAWLTPSGRSSEVKPFQQWKVKRRKDPSPGCKPYLIETMNGVSDMASPHSFLITSLAPPPKNGLPSWHPNAKPITVKKTHHSDNGEGISPESPFTLPPAKVTPHPKPMQPTSPVTVGMRKSSSIHIPRVIKVGKMMRSLKPLVISLRLFGSTRNMWGMAMLIMGTVIRIRIKPIGISSRDTSRLGMLRGSLRKAFCHHSCRNN